MMYTIGVPDLPDRVAVDAFSVETTTILPRHQAITANGLVVAKSGTVRGVGVDRNFVAVTVVGEEVHVNAGILVAFLQLHLQVPWSIHTGDFFRQDIAALANDINTRIERKRKAIRRTHGNYYKWHKCRKNRTVSCL